jgi:hypothetical protein
MNLDGKFDKVIDTAAPLIAFGVGLNAAVTTATLNTNPSGNFTSKFVTFVSQVAGPTAGNALNQGLGTSYPVASAPQFKPTGALNTGTFAGIGILVTNYILKELGIPGYNKYAAPIVGAIGTGQLGGSVIGGIFDPAGFTGQAQGPSVGRIATRIPQLANRSVGLSVY